MEGILKKLIDKRNYYDSIAEKARLSLEKAPKDGNLRIAYSKGIPQYYLITEKGDTNGKYIPNKDIKIAQTIAQRDYDKKIYKCAVKWSKSLQRFINDIPKEDLKDIHSKSLGRKKIIRPYILSDEEFLAEWESVEYKGRSFEEGFPEILTEKGERVRSKSEKIIADKLFMMGIPYRYEYPITLRGYGTIYPDFTLLNIRRRKEIVLEHFGMMDNPEYCTKVIDKLNLYTINGMFMGDKLLATYETSQKPLSMTVLADILRRFVLN